MPLVHPLVLEQDYGSCQTISDAITYIIYFHNIISYAGIRIHYDAYTY